MAAFLRLGIEETVNALMGGTGNDRDRMIEIVLLVAFFAIPRYTDVA